MSKIANIFAIRAALPLVLLTTAVALLSPLSSVRAAELQDALNRIWRAPQKAKISGLWSLLRARLLSFGMILGIGFLLTSMVYSFALSWLFVRDNTRRKTMMMCFNALITPTAVWFVFSYIFRITLP